MRFVYIFGLRGKQQRLRRNQWIVTRRGHDRWAQTWISSSESSSVLVSSGVWGFAAGLTGDFVVIWAKRDQRWLYAAPI